MFAEQEAQERGQLLSLIENKSFSGVEHVYARVYGQDVYMYTVRTWLIRHPTYYTDEICDTCNIVGA